MKHDHDTCNDVLLGVEGETTGHEACEMTIIAWGLLYDHQWWMLDHKEVFELNAQLQVRLTQMTQKVQAYTGLAKALRTLQHEVVEVVSRCKIEGITVFNDPWEARRKHLIDVCTPPPELMKQ